MTPKNNKVVRERVANIDLQSEEYEIRADYGRYGISHYAAYSAKTKKSILNKFDKVLRENRGGFVVVKPVATGKSVVKIKEYDKLKKHFWAVFTHTSYKGIEFHGISEGVDRQDAASNINIRYWFYSRRQIKLLIMENGKIKRDVFADQEVKDISMEERSFGTSMKLPYFRIKGDPIPKKEVIEAIDESKLY